MRLSNKDLYRNHWLLLLTGFMLVFFSGFGQTVFIGVHIPFIRESFNLSHTQLSGLYSAATLLSGIILFFSGKLLDKITPRYFVAITLTGLAAGAFLLSWSTVPAVLLIAFFLVRQFGQGLMTLTNTVSMNRYLENARGRAMAITSFGMPVQLLVFPFMAAILIENMGWESAYRSYGYFILFILLPMFFLLFRHHDRTAHAAWQKTVEEEEMSSVENPIKQWTRLAVLKDWRLYILLMVMIVDPCFSTAIFYYQGELSLSKGLEATDIVSAFPFFTVASVCTMYIAGSLLDRFGEKYLLICAPLFYICGLSCLIIIEGMPSLYTGLVALGISMGTMSVLGGPLLAHLYGTRHLSSIKSILSSVFIVGTAISPLLVGYNLDQGVAIAQILMIFAVYAFIAWLIMIIFLRNHLNQDS